MDHFFMLPIYNMDMYHLVHSFFIYGILGWIVESIYMSFCNHKLTNRGFIKGPICPIYGVGATVIYTLLYPLAGHYIAIYFVGMVVATSLEYVTAQIMLRIFGEVWWDYTDKPFNYRGIICLESSIVWGVYCVITFAFLQQMIFDVIDWYTDKIGIMFGQLIAVFLILYYMVSFIRKVRAEKAGFISEQMEQVQRVWRAIRK